MKEAATISAILEPIRTHLMESSGLVDELLVLDHASQDQTAATSARAGARVIDADGLLPAFGPAVGKGDVLWRSLFASTGDIIVWLDADLESFTPNYVTRLLAPLLRDPGLAFVRATYGRSLHGVSAEGGRVTELTARPALKLLRPHLSHIRQPLGGEYAIRRDVAESLPFEVDYGVEIGLLIDIADAYGVGSIAQVRLDSRVHRNRPLNELHEQAVQVLRAILSRSGHPTVRGLGALRPPMSHARTLQPVTAH